MNETIWSELAECIGRALAKRWLRRRTRPTNPVTSEIALTAKPLSESNGAADETIGLNALRSGSDSSK
jgi:hypothetical protein